MYQPSRLLKPEDINDYEKIISENVSILTDDKGRFQPGNLYKVLDEQIRRGWPIRGIHYNIAESSGEHTEKLGKAGKAISHNKYFSLALGEIVFMIEVHDMIDGIFFDIIPSDDPQVVARKSEMEMYGMKYLCNTIQNGLGYKIMGHYVDFEQQHSELAKTVFWLDKQDAATNSRKIRNTFDEIRKYYNENPQYQEFIITAHDPTGKMNLEQALDKTYERLGEFYINNQKRLILPYQKGIAREVEEYTGADVYTMYYNRLANFNPEDFE